ncbi:tripartite tricarboxylate transporter substrate binding protein [Belnapia sp. T6]|uniref:Tripartite tricarboxylate transporter substrate binding protein n=1 Tax=Belnapia mucosa TaxID=2804532 RepID=A0ABS1V7B8_9PROT|nr:tripartite tricarboxylate transporter substrate binding protein [Belnapia mucosa]MBL6457559.1 tripartite tricarboxylate transporter substrate binding protein [Belnapia mucosa]
MAGRSMATGRRVLVAGLLTAPWVARAQSGFPNRPITLIVPFPPGGTTDVTLRALAEGASRRLPQQVVVDNKPGAANTLGASMVARARPDGYLLTQLPASAIRVQLLQKLPYDTLRDFTPVMSVTGYSYVVIAKTGRFPNGWADVLAEARRRPGQLSFGSTGVNGTPHVTMAELAQREGVEMVHVPFRGDADGSQALLGGHIDVMAGGSGLGALVDGGQAQFLHVWTAERLRRWPQAPTLKELGYDMVVTTPFGLVAPAGLDPAVTRILHDAFAAAQQTEEFRAVLDRFDMPDEYRDSAAYGAMLRETVAREEALIRRLNLTAG